jgi:hypothetical protein
MATVEHDTTYEYTTRDEIRIELDRLARDRLGISGEDFIARWQGGRLDEFSPTVSRIAVLARLITD